MDRGYLALYRKIQDHPFYKERREFSKLEAWIDILMEAQHSKKSQEVALGMNILICNYGDSLKSLRTWAIRWRWSPTKVKRFFQLLEKLNQIKVKNETVTTRISVLNYYKYDPKRNTNETRPKHNRNTTETQAVTDKNVKNVKNDNKERKNSKKNPSFKKYLQEKIIENNFIETKDKIFEFFNYRMEMPAAKRYKSEKGLNGLFRNLNQCRSAGLIISDCLEIAMERNWLSFEPSYFDNKKQNNNFPSRSEKNKQACQEFIIGAGNER